MLPQSSEIHQRIMRERLGWSAKSPQSKGKVLDSLCRKARETSSARPAPHPSGLWTKLFGLRWTEPPWSPKAAWGSLWLAQKFLDLLWLLCLFWAGHQAGTCSAYLVGHWRAVYEAPTAFFWTVVWAVNHLSRIPGWNFWSVWNGDPWLKHEWSPSLYRFQVHNVTIR